MQTSEKNFLHWSLAILAVVVILIFVPGWLKKGWAGVRTWLTADLPTEDESIKQVASQEPTIGVVVDGEDAGMEVDMSDALLIVDLKEGTGPEVKAGDTIRAHYTGTLNDGTVFDSSYDRGEPLEFTIGVGQVIKGWDDGIVGMKAGGQRRLTIPPEMGYGNRAVGSIPAGSTLNFVVELVEIVP